MFAYIHFQKYKRYGFWEDIYTSKYRTLDPETEIIWSINDIILQTKKFLK